MHYLSHIDRERLPEVMAQTDALDLRGVRLYGLFDDHGRKITGNIERIPDGISLDGVVHFLPGGAQQVGAKEPVRARGLAREVGTNETLILARATNVLDN